MIGEDHGLKLFFPVVDDNAGFMTDFGNDLPHGDVHGLVEMPPHW